ncbi:hypothetical protein ABZO31_17015 [Streptomyces sp. HUAS MG47]|uniref:hypothetical protein n=1 Tax=Streptomyces solicamelliae TaxID=3231716 RepID=UPI0038783C95
MTPALRGARTWAVCGPLVAGSLLAAAAAPSAYAERGPYGHGHGRGYGYGQQGRVYAPGSAAPAPVEEPSWLPEGRPGRPAHHGPSAVPSVVPSTAPSAVPSVVTSPAPSAVPVEASAAAVEPEPAASLAGRPAGAGRERPGRPTGEKSVAPSPSHTGTAPEAEPPAEEETEREEVLGEESAPASSSPAATPAAAVRLPGPHTAVDAADQQIPVLTLGVGLALVGLGIGFFGVRMRRH